MFWFLLVDVVVIVVVFRMIGVVREIEKAEEHVQANSDKYSILDECNRSGRTLMAAAAVILTGNTGRASTGEIKTYFAFSAFTLTY